MPAHNHVRNPSVVMQNIMDVSSSSVASIGVSGLLRDGWSGLSDALAPVAGSLAPSAINLTPGSSGTTAIPSNNNSAVSTPTKNGAELLELTTRLTRQLKRAEETCRRIELREKSRVDLLKRCLVACCAKESAEVLELALEIAANEDPDVDRDAREFKELLIVRSTPDEQIEVELDRIAQLEKEMKEERAARIRAEEEKTVLQARIQTQQEAWETERERYFLERKSVEDTVKERVKAESSSFEQRLKSIEQMNRDRLQLETAKLTDKIRTLETKLEKEMLENRQRRQVDEQLTAEAVRMATLEKDEEIARLHRRVAEAEDGSRTERELVSFAMTQSSKERVLKSLENRIHELEAECMRKDDQIYDLKTQLQGAVPPEILGPARGDYLRHIVLRYLTFDNIAQKQALIPVIATLLNFTPEEKKLCEVCAARDVAKDGVMGSLATSFQSMPIHSLFSSSSSSTAPNSVRAVLSSARYIPVSTSNAQNGENAE